jgi:hypothetical protein
MWEKDDPGMRGASFHRSSGVSRERGDFFSGAPKIVGGYALWTVRVTYWLLVTVLVLPAIPILYSWLRRRRRREQNACIACGYDLRATPDRCPECGTVVAPRGI